MRVLIDYRPALRERSGVGEYVLPTRARAARRVPGRTAAPPVDLTLFSSSWKDRVAARRRARRARARRSAHAGPPAELRVAPAGWPPAEALTRRRVRRRPLAASAAAAVAIGRAGRHDSRPVLSEPSRTTARRGPPRLSGAGPRARAPRRPDHRAVAVHRRRGRARAWTSPPDRISVCPHGARPGPPRTTVPATATCCSSARSSRGRTSAASSTPTSACSGQRDAARRTGPVAPRRARARPGRAGPPKPPGRGSSGSRSRRCRASSGTSATSTRLAAASCTRARACSSSRPSRKASACRCSKR